MIFDLCYYSFYKLNEGEKMKRCEYCCKEITYHQMYCNDDCEDNANRFYEKRDAIEKLIGIINGICVLSIGIGLFIFSFSKALGGYMVSIPLDILGILFLLFPIPADVMINKYKIEKSVKITRIIAIIVLVLGIIASVFTILFT